MTLVVLWALATAVTLGPGLELLSAQDNVTSVGRPAQSVVTQLQRERKLTLVYLATARRDAAAMNAQRAATDEAISRFRRSAGDAPSSTGGPTGQRVAALLSSLDSLPGLRTSVDHGEIDRSGAMRHYTGTVDAAFAVFASALAVPDAELAGQARAITALARGRDLLAQEDALIGGVAAAGRVSAAELAQVVQLVGARRFLFAETAPDLHPADREEFQQLTQTDAFTRIAQIEDRLATEGRPDEGVPIDVGGWRSAYDGVSGELERFEQRAESNLGERSRPAALLIVGRVIVAGLLGLVAVVITVVASVRIGRSLIRRLAGLRQAALELAVDRLPHVVSRLRRGEEVDVLHESPALPYSDDEIGQVGHAFNEVQRTAVNAAVEEAAVRRGLNEVFLNIARRSQTLLHRQLSILDGMEKRADDPEELEDLFRLDHLATRMRRHAEDLVILAGASPGRGWRSPVSVVDVVRGAVSEVEDYARVAIRPMPDVAVTGRAVGDVIHLLAELIENATSFSPPHTRVYVGAEVVAHGLAIEIEDRGLGLTLDAIAEANHRLADPPEFDPANSARLGLFVVARLAARHGVKVQLRPSAYGGITAVALLPDALVAAGDATRPREAIAAMPAAAYLSAESNGSARVAREIVTAPRPAIAAPPQAEPPPRRPIPGRRHPRLAAHHRPSHHRLGLRRVHRPAARRRARRPGTHGRSSSPRPRQPAPTACRGVFVRAASRPSSGIHTHRTRRPRWPTEASHGRLSRYGR